MSAILLVNGPNLGILGQREPDVYGTATLADIERAVAEEVAERGWEVISVQHESEGELVSAIHRNYDTVGAIVNPGALMIAGWSLRDALKAYPKPWIEVHLSNVWAREQFRHESVLAPLASGVVVGLGPLGYRLGAQALLAIHRPAPTVRHTNRLSMVPSVSSFDEPASGSSTGSSAVSGVGGQSAGKEYSA